MARIAAEDALAAPAEQEFADYWGGQGEAWEAQAAANPGPVPDGWDAPLPELGDEEINRIDADRERAEQEAVEDERQPGGPLWDDEHGRPYDDATCARLINEARYPEPKAGSEQPEPAPEADAERAELFAEPGYDCDAPRDAEHGRAEPAAELEAGS